ncbi:MAG: hypothetical protein JXR94_24525, partial [Candidatus Hydrogenedentes bacterium]|nr:hypothetical protein [Candidatus Hydrogenedentota bacterium]
MSDASNTLDGLLKGVRRAWWTSVILTGAPLVAGVACAFFLAVLLLDNLLLLPAAARWMCLGVGTVLIAAAVWRWLLGRLPAFASGERLAAYFEERVDGVDNELINTVQFTAAARSGVGEGALAHAMVRTYIAAATERLERYTGWEAFERSRIRSSLKRGALPVMALAAYAVLFPAGFWSGAFRL